MLFIGPPLWHPTKPWNIDSICKHTYTHKYMHSHTPLHMEHQGHYAWYQGGVLKCYIMDRRKEDKPITVLWTISCGTVPKNSFSFGGIKLNRSDPGTWNAFKCFLSFKAADKDLLHKLNPQPGLENLGHKDILTKTKKQKIYFAIIEDKKLIVKYKSVYIRLYYFCVAYLRRKQS